MVSALLLSATCSRAADSLAQLEEQAVKAAIARVAPSVVRIETVGGLERVGNVLVGTGSTTGLVISSDGYIISSAFNFAQKPDSILVTLADGSRLAAKRVATDYARKLVLLKVSPTSPLAVPEAVPVKEIRPGQTALALGRTFESDRPSVSMGIISAVGRIWDKAVQTDAKVSPNNYGGPLVDITGRVQGVLAPLTTEQGGETAGVDWYDSGIGFAVPLEHVLQILPRLKTGNDLHPGLLGINLKSADIYSPPAEIAAARANSPADKAGIKAGDVIVEAEGQPVTRQAQLKTVLGRHYAGDKVTLVVKRGDERLTLEVPLVEKLEPYEFPFLGILPLRFPNDVTAGLVVRYVYPDSPASKAGLVEGDVIRSLDGKAVANAVEAAEALHTLSPDKSIALAVVRDEKTIKLDVRLGRLPEQVPDNLPPAVKLDPPHAAKPAAAAEKQDGKENKDVPALPAVQPAPSDTKPLAAERPQTGQITLKMPEFENSCLAYIPESYDERLAYGLVVWLHAPGGSDEDKLLERWKPLCEAHQLILLAPKSADPTRWAPSESAFIRRFMAEIARNYTIDPARIVIHGQEAGGAMAYVVAFANRNAVRGVAVVDAPLPTLTLPPESNPVERLAFYTTRPAKAPFVGQLDAGVKKLRDLKFPVTVVEVDDASRYLTADELAGLIRWIDTLDRL